MTFIELSRSILLLSIDSQEILNSSLIFLLVEVNEGKQIIGCGLDLDFKGEPFGSMPYLLCYATTVNKLYAICMKCKNEFGSRTQRLMNGKPAKSTEPQITIEGEDRRETYEARCIKCHEVL